MNFDLGELYVIKLALEDRIDKLDGILNGSTANKILCESKESAKITLSKVEAVIKEW